MINDTGDLGVKRRLQYLTELQALARDVNRRLLDHERVAQGCVPCESSPCAGRATIPGARPEGANVTARRPFESKPRPALPINIHCRDPLAVVREMGWPTRR